MEAEVDRRIIGVREHIATDGSLRGISGRGAACGLAVVQVDHNKEEAPWCASSGTMLAKLEVQRTIKKQGQSYAFTMAHTPTHQSTNPPTTPPPHPTQPNPTQPHPNPRHPRHPTHSHSHSHSHSQPNPTNQNRSNCNSKRMSFRIPVAFSHSLLAT